MDILLNRRAWIACGAAAALPALAQERVPLPAFDLQGHRGARGLRPENALAAFAHALAIGVHTLELDIGFTRDGVPVIAHDRRLNPAITRGPDGRYLEGAGPRIAELTLAELARYDVGRIRAGTKYAQDFPGQQAVDGERIPTLAALFELVRGTPGAAPVRFDIETKTAPDAPDDTLPPEAFARRLVAAVRQGGMQHRSSVQSFDWRTLAVVQREAPELPTVYLTIQQGRDGGTVGNDPGTGTAWTAGHRRADHGGSLPRMIRDLGGHAWSAFHRDLTPALIDEAHALGLKVLAWTVNEPARMGELIGWGIDGLITDYPDRARGVMQARGMPLPPAAP